MKTFKARVQGGGIHFPSKLGVKEGTEVRVLIPDAGLKPASRRGKKAGLAPARQELLDRIVARRDRIGPVGFSLAAAIREDRERGR